MGVAATVYSLLRATNVIGMTSALSLVLIFTHYGHGFRLPMFLLLLCLQSQSRMPELVIQSQSRMHELVKVAVCGACGVGKTALLSSFVHRKLPKTYRPSIGVDFSIKHLHGRDIVLQLWDIAGNLLGQNQYLPFRGSSHVLILYNTGRPESLTAVDTWIEQLASYELAAQVVVVGLRVPEPQRKVSQAEGHGVASQYGVPWVELDLEDHIGLEAFFERLVDGQILVARPGCVRHPRPLAQELRGFGNIDQRPCH